MAYFNSSNNTPNLSEDNVSVFLNKLTFEIKNIGEWVSKSDKIANYTINDFEIIYYQDGGSKTTFDKKTYHLEKDDILLLEPYGLYTSINTNHERYAYTYIHFNIYPTSSHEMFKKLFFAQVPIIPKAKSSLMGELIKQMQIEYHHQDIGKASLMNTYLKHLCIPIIREQYNQKLIVTDKITISNLQINLVSKCLEFITNNISTMYKIEDLAQLCHVSPSYIYKSFMLMINESPSTFIAHYKIDSAKKMLLTKAYPVNEIAHSLGYSTINHFSTAFKKQVGVSPTTFQKQSTLNENIQIK